jgi:hypothetical protein
MLRRLEKYLNNTCRVLSLPSDAGSGNDNDSMVVCLPRHGFWPHGMSIPGARYV